MSISRWSSDSILYYCAMRGIPEETGLDFYKYYPEGKTPDGRPIRHFEPMLEKFWEKRRLARARRGDPQPSLEEILDYARELGLSEAFGREFHQVYFIAYKGTLMQNGNPADRVPIRDWRAFMRSRAAKEERENAGTPPAARSASHAAPAPETREAERVRADAFSETEETPDHSDLSHSECEPAPIAAGLSENPRPAWIITQNIEEDAAAQAAAWEAEGRVATIASPDGLADLPKDAFAIIVMGDDTRIAPELMARALGRMVSAMDRTRIVSAFGPAEVAEHVPDARPEAIDVFQRHMLAAMRGELAK